MNRILSIIVFILCLVWSTHVFSEELQKNDNNLENIARQYVECAAYYQIVSDSFKVSGNGKAVNSYLALRNTAKSYSVSLSSESMGQDLAVQLINSRFKMRKSQMSGEIYHKYENLAIIIDKYHFNCQEIIENPPAELMAILTKSKSEAENQAESTNN
jgi:hypothetical protein